MIIFQVPDRSVINRIDPRVRVVVAVAFAVSVCLVRDLRFEAVGLSLMMALLLSVLAGVGAGRLIKNLKYLNFLMLMLAIILPLSIQGESIFSAGGLSWSSPGLLRVAMIALRANSIMITLIALLTTMEPAHLGFALGRLGLGNKFPHILLFMIRYIEVIHQEYHRLRDALRLRGFRAGFNRHTFKTFGYIVGLLLVQSIDRSERISDAMKCRGFRGCFYVLAPFKLTLADGVFMTLASSCIIFICWIAWV